MALLLFLLCYLDCWWINNSARNNFRLPLSQKKYRSLYFFYNFSKRSCSNLFIYLETRNVFLFHRCAIIMVTSLFHNNYITFYFESSLTALLHDSGWIPFVQVHLCNGGDVNSSSNKSLLIKSKLLLIKTSFGDLGGHMTSLHCVWLSCTLKLLLINSYGVPLPHLLNWHKYSINVFLYFSFWLCSYYAGPTCIQIPSHWATGPHYQLGVVEICFPSLIL